MNLFALEGHKVWCSTLVGGNNYDQELAEKHLEKYMKYTVERTKVYSFHTDVWLKEFPDVSFNSVFFKDVEEQSMEKTKQHHDYPKFLSYMEPVVEEVNSVVPTFEEYQEAMLVVNAYNEEHKKQHDKRVECFRVDLQEYFDNYLIDGMYRLVEFKLRTGLIGIGEIIPLKPSLEENYNGGNDDDIKRLCEKHGVDFSIVYWCYHK